MTALNACTGGNVPTALSFVPLSVAQVIEPDRVSAGTQNVISMEQNENSGVNLIRGFAATVQQFVLFTNRVVNRRSSFSNCRVGT